jgi:hypothetical protein
MAIGPRRLMDQAVIVEAGHFKDASIANVRTWVEAASSFRRSTRGGSLGVNSPICHTARIQEWPKLGETTD